MTSSRRPEVHNVSQRRPSHSHSLHAQVQSRAKTRGHIWRHLVNTIKRSGRFTLGDDAYCRFRYWTNLCITVTIGETSYHAAKRYVPSRWQFNGGGAYRWCSRLANASEAAPFRPLLLTSWFDFLLVLCSNHSSKGHGTDRQTDRRTERTQHCLMTPVVGIIQRDSQTFVVMSICCGLVVYDKLQTIQQIDNKSKRWSLSHTNQQRSSRFHSNRCRRSRCMR